MERDFRGDRTHASKRREREVARLIEPSAAFVAGGLLGRTDGLWVFDWEYARERANPLSDLLHFRLAPRAVVGRGANSRLLRRTMQQAGRFARKVYPDCDWSRGVIGGLTLEYLLQRYCLIPHRVTF